jgi:hypothetical protein
MKIVARIIARLGEITIVRVGMFTKSRVCFDKGCSSGSCYNDETQDEELVESCDYGCEEGVCTEPPLFTINFPLNSSVSEERRVLFDVEASEKLDLIEYIDYSDSRPRWRRLCSRCEEFSRERSFRDGVHEVFVRCTPYVGEPEEQEVIFFTDSRDPRISRTEPSRGFANGMFNVKFREDNPSQITIHYGNSYTGYWSDSIVFNSVPEECEVDDRGNWECDVNVSLDQFDGKDIEYWFELKDIVDNTDESRHYDLTVDLTPPVLNNPGSYWEQGEDRYNRYIYFDFDVSEENFEEINYIDWTDRTPRERRLCSRLRDGICEVRKSFRRGEHSLTVLILDEAGNSWQDSFAFMVE